MRNLAKDYYEKTLKESSDDFSIRTLNEYYNHNLAIAEKINSLVPNGYDVVLSKSGNSWLDFEVRITKNYTEQYNVRVGWSGKDKLTIHPCDTSFYIMSRKNRDRTYAGFSPTFSKLNKTRFLKSFNLAKDYRASVICDAMNAESDAKNRFSDLRIKLNEIASALGTGIIKTYSKDGSVTTYRVNSPLYEIPLDISYNKNTAEVSGGHNLDRLLKFIKLIIDTRKEQNLTGGVLCVDDK